MCFFISDNSTLPISETLKWRSPTCHRPINILLYYLVVTLRRRVGWVFFSHKAFRYIWIKPTGNLIVSFRHWSTHSYIFGGSVWKPSPLNIVLTGYTIYFTLLWYLISQWGYTFFKGGDDLYHFLTAALNIINSQSHFLDWEQHKCQYRSQRLSSRSKISTEQEGLGRFRSITKIKSVDHFKVLQN